MHGAFGRTTQILSHGVMISSTDSNPPNSFSSPDNYHQKSIARERERDVMERKYRPLILAMKGHPGTGKSTLARAIAAALRCPLLDKDDVRDPTLPIQLRLDSSASGTGAALLNDLSYAVLWRTADTQLRLGLSVVIDSPLSCRAHLDRILSLAAAAGARVAVVECRPADEAEWRRRLESRADTTARGGEGWHKPATWAELLRLVEGYEGRSDYGFEGVPRLVVDTTATATAEDVVAEVMEFLKSN